jgi:histidine triad (HIT) family protein
MVTLFSRIIAGEIPGTFVHRDEHCVVFMTINPITDGHVLVVPIMEVDHWIDLPSEISAHLFSVSQRISRALSESFPCERIGMIIAGYEVNHCHIHLIPTHSMADLNFANAAAKVERSTIEEHAQRITTALAKI